MAKRKADSCLRHYIYGSMTLCVHELFRRKIVAAIVDEYDRWGTLETYMWQGYNRVSKFNAGSRWRITSQEQMDEAVELAYKHKVPIIGA